MFVLPQIKKELFTEKTRIILTILAIAWGTFAISSMLAIGEGLKLTFAETVSHVGTNLLKIQPGRTTKVYRGRHENIQIKLTKTDLALISKLPNIAAVSSSYILAKKMRYKDKELTKQTLAVAANYAKIHEIEVLSPGRFISPLDIKQHKSVIVLGTDSAKDYFPHEANPINKYIYVGNKPFLIIGVMKHKTQIMAHRQPDSAANWIPVTTYEMLANPKHIDSIDITYKDPALLPQLQQHIVQTVALNHGADPNDGNVVHFRDYARRQDKINDFFLGLQVFLGIVGALTLLVAGVGIANVMYASVNRATREIGIRMAIGARTYQILLHYIIEAIVATFLGGILGLIMSGLVVFGLRQIPMHGKLIETIGQPKPVLSFSVVAIVIVVLGITGFLAGLFPALKATKVDPSEALAYE